MRRRNVLKYGLLAGAGVLSPKLYGSVPVLYLPEIKEHVRHGAFDLSSGVAENQGRFQNVQLNRFYSNGWSASNSDKYFLTFDFDGQSQCLELSVSEVSEKGSFVMKNLSYSQGLLMIVV